MELDTLSTLSFDFRRRLYCALMSYVLLLYKGLSHSEKRHHVLIVQACDDLHGSQTLRCLISLRFVAFLR